jgi:hypothetical protein
MHGTGIETKIKTGGSSVELKEPPKAQIEVAHKITPNNT